MVASKNKMPNKIDDTNDNKNIENALKNSGNVSGVGLAVRIGESYVTNGG
jgi:hypothetical protein